MTNKNIETSLFNLLINNKESILPFKDDFHIENRESPDYCIYNNNLKIGIEITRAMDENLQKAKKERDKLDSKLSFSPTLFENKKMSSIDIKKDLYKSKDKLIGMAYRENELEKLVFLNIKKSIIQKIKKFKDYEKFDENWLYIYHDNRVTLEIEFVINLIENYIKEIDLLFDILLLKIGKYFYKFNNYKLIKQIKYNN